MYNAKALEEFAKNKLKAIPLFGWTHLLRVKTNAELIANGLQFDSKILHAAIYLHDLGVEQALKYNQDAVATSIVLAKNFMLNNNFSSEEIDKILHCISEQHLQGKPKTNEAKILHDAEMLDNCGAIGILKDSYVLAKYTKNSRQIKEYFNAKANLLKNAFFTDSGKKLAADKLELYQQFAKSLEIG